MNRSYFLKASFFIPVQDHEFFLWKFFLLPNVSFQFVSQLLFADNFLFPFLFFVLAKDLEPKKSTSCLLFALPVWPEMQQQTGNLVIITRLLCKISNSESCCSSPRTFRPKRSFSCSKSLILIRCSPEAWAWWPEIMVFPV